MKKLILAVLFLVIPTLVMAAGSVKVRCDRLSEDMVVVTFQCTGDATNGTIPDTALPVNDSYSNRCLEHVIGLYPYRVVISNTSAQTDVTDNSDVYLRYKSGSGEDLFNGKGVDQLDKDVTNYIRLTEFDPITAAPYLDVDNNSAVSSQYDIEITFVK